MPSLSTVVTTIGLQQLAAGTFAPDRVLVGTGVPGTAHGLGTTALHTLLKTVIGTATEAQVGFEVVTIDASTVRLKMQLVDQSTDAYTLKEFAVADASGNLLVVYSQAADIAVKAAASSLHLDIDMSLANATVAQIQLGATDFLMPNATVSASGAVQLASQADVDAGTEPARAITPETLAASARLRSGTFTPYLDRLWHYPADNPITTPSGSRSQLASTQALIAGSTAKYQRVNEIDMISAYLKFDVYGLNRDDWYALELTLSPGAEATFNEGDVTPHVHTYRFGDGSALSTSDLNLHVQPLTTHPLTRLAVLFRAGSSGTFGTGEYLAVALTGAYEHNAF